MKKFLMILILSIGGLVFGQAKGSPIEYMDHLEKPNATTVACIKKHGDESTETFENSRLEFNGSKSIAFEAEAVCGTEVGRFTYSDVLLVIAIGLLVAAALVA